MTKTTVKTSSGSIIQFTPSVPAHVKPKVQIERTDDDGVTWYETACGRVFRADLFDKMFKTKRGTIRPINYREDINSKRKN